MARDGLEQTRLALTIGRGENGLSASMTLLDIGVSRWPAQSVEQSEGELRLIFPADSGPQEMVLCVEGQSMTGTWREGRFETAASVNLTRAEQGSSAREQRMLIEGPAGKLGASLIMPAGTD